jgi:hypothetical protein
MSDQDQAPLCACGCGLPTTRSKRTRRQLGFKKGEWRKYIAHHKPYKQPNSHWTKDAKRDAEVCRAAIAEYKAHHWREYLLAFEVTYFGGLLRARENIAARGHLCRYLLGHGCSQASIARVTGFNRHHVRMAARREAA